METEVNGGSYYKESEATKADQPDASVQANQDLGEMSPPKNVPSPNSSSTRKKLRVDGVLPNTRVCQRVPFVLILLCCRVLQACILATGPITNKTYSHRQ